MKKLTKTKKPTPGSRILASIHEAIEWAEGKDISARVTTIDVPMIDVKQTRRKLGLSQAACRHSETPGGGGGFAQRSKLRSSQEQTAVLLDKPELT